MNDWRVFAVLSAVFAAATAVLAKIGITGVPSTLGTALRTTVVLVFGWIMALALGEHRALPTLGRRSLLFLALSGLATGLSWLAYFRALQLGPTSRVAAIDKSSLALTIVLAWIVLREPITMRLMGGAVLILAGTFLVAR